MSRAKQTIKSRRKWKKFDVGEIIGERKKKDVLFFKMRMNR